MTRFYTDSGGGERESGHRQNTTAGSFDGLRLDLMYSSTLVQLEPGTTPEHYSVIEPLGKGGMGEVHRFDRLMDRTLRQWERLGEDLARD